MSIRCNKSPTQPLVMLDENNNGCVGGQSTDDLRRISMFCTLPSALLRQQQWLVLSLQSMSKSGHLSHSGGQESFTNVQVPRGQSHFPGGGAIKNLKKKKKR